MKKYKLKIELTDGTFQEVEFEAPGGVDFTTDDTLSIENGVLSVNTASAVDQDNTLPITSAAVAATVGNIEILLKTI